MQHIFYRVAEKTNDPEIWMLGKIRCDGGDFGAQHLTSGQHIAYPGKLDVAVARSGHPTVFSFTIAFVPIVTKSVGQLVDRMAPGAVERLPVTVGGVHEYQALNVIRALDVVDRERSQYTLWNPEDGRPDKLGQFRQVYPLVIKSDVGQEACIFRVTGWETALIVSEKLKSALEKSGALGVSFRPVDGGLTAR